VPMAVRARLATRAAAMPESPLADAEVTHAA